MFGNKTVKYFLIGTIFVIAIIVLIYCLTRKKENFVKLKDEENNQLVVSKNKNKWQMLHLKRA